MPLVDVRRAIYAYTPVNSDELEMREGDVLYIQDNSSPDWLLAKRKVFRNDDPEEEGLVPANHTERVAPIGHARALYAYEPALDEEATLDEETTLVEGEDVQIIEMDDRDWYMARTKSGYGFVPKSYVELLSDMKQQPGTPNVAESKHAHDLFSATPALPPLPTAPVPAEPIGQASVQQPPPPLPQQAFSTPNDTDDAHSAPLSPVAAAPLPPVPPPPPLPGISDLALTMQTQQQQYQQQQTQQQQQQKQVPDNTISHFNVVLGKKKKGKRITLGISNAILVVDTNEDTVPPKQYATRDIGKCAVKKTSLIVEIGGYEPAAFDITCASNAEAERIGDAINAARRGMFIGDRPLDLNRSDQPPPPPPKDFVQPPPVAETLKPVPPLPLHKGETQEFAVMLYDFESEDPEELTVAKDERVVVLEKPDDGWWSVQMEPPNGRKGLVPASYLELVTAAPADNVSFADVPTEEFTPVLPIRTSTVLQAAADIRTAPQLKSPSLTQSPSPLQPEPQRHAVDDMVPPIERGKTPDTDNLPLQLLPRQPPVENTPPPLPPAPSSSAAANIQGPDPSKVRSWTDGTGSYTVEAEFIKLDNDGLVHLHKTNGKKISVALAKFSADDRRYVEKLLGMATSQAPSKTARQRQQEQARKTPGRRIINYDWDWFDFFTLKGGVSADNALKYATSFVAERLDDKSIPEITPEYMHTLGVKSNDISRLDHAFRVHSGVASVPESAPVARERSPIVQPKPIREPVRELTREPVREPERKPVYSPTASNTTSSNPWGVDSELDRRFGRFRQIESDEAFARKLQQQEEEERKNPPSRRHHHPPHQSTQPGQRQSVDPFTSLDESNAPSANRPSAAVLTSESKQPLNLGLGSRKGAGSVVDPAQLRTAMHRTVSPTGNNTVSGGARSPGGRTAIDEAFGTIERHSPMAAMQPEQAPPPRARPTVQHIRQASANIARAASPANPGELTTTRMAAAAASGNTAQVQRLEQQAIAKAQELAAQEARLRQQQENIRKQAQFLQQQQQQLLQMQQSQKVEAQMNQLREERERLEKQRQTEELQKQMAVLKTQQEQMLKMQQMASQARSMQNAAPAFSAAPGAATAVSAAPGMSALQQSQQGSLASRLPPPLVPTSVSKPQQQHQLQQQHQQQLFSSANPISPVGAFAAAQGISNIPAASSSTTRLTPMANGGVFSSHALAGSTPNLGSLNKPMLGASNYANTQSSAQNISNFGSLNQSSSQLLPQQLQQLMTPQQQFVPQQQQQFMQPQQQQLPMGNMSLPNQNQNRYDLFKSINPQAPGIFTGQQPQQSVMANPQFSSASVTAPAFSASGLMQPSIQHSTGPTGIFAIPNPTVSQPSAMFGNGSAGFQQHIQPQQQQQQQQQQPQQQQQMFTTGQAGAFGGQMQWR